jgi:hypothetical protein
MQTEPLPSVLVAQKHNSAVQHLQTQASVYASLRTLTLFLNQSRYN